MKTTNALTSTKAARSRPPKRPPSSAINGAASGGPGGDNGAPRHDRAVAPASPGRAGVASSAPQRHRPPSASERLHTRRTVPGCGAIDRAASREPGRDAGALRDDLDAVLLPSRTPVLDVPRGAFHTVSDLPPMMFQRYRN